VKKNLIYIFDTTLRDGAQAEGISFTVEDKINIARTLRDFGIHYIEGGWPGSNPRDVEFFSRMKKISLAPSKLTAFGSTRRKNIKPSEDRNLIDLLAAEPDAFCIFGKTSLMHVKVALETTPEENLKMIQDSVKFLKRTGKEVIYDAEHFFDGYAENADYAILTLSSAVKGGAEWISLCDTNGGTMPERITELTNIVRKNFRGVKLAIHAHNDCGLAVANSLAAVDAGAEMVQGTLNGWGERCGNADLSAVIANLILKKKKVIANFTKKNLKHLVRTSRYIDEVANIISDKSASFTGASAFAHKGGVHVSAVMKNASTYEHIAPAAVGNERRILVSDLSGRANLKVKSRQMNIDLKDRKTSADILNDIKKRELRGYQYEAADASLKILMRKHTGRMPDFFDIINCRVILEYANERKKYSKKCEASVKLIIKDSPVYEVAEGDGPVNALDNALRKALLPFYPQVGQIALTDFKVRVLNPKEATAAAVRVFIESKDNEELWTTVGVSEDVIEASWEALLDSILYKLLKE